MSPPVLCLQHGYNPETAQTPRCESRDRTRNQEEKVRVCVFASARKREGVYLPLISKVLPTRKKESE